MHKRFLSLLLAVGLTAALTGGAAASAAAGKAPKLDPNGTIRLTSTVTSLGWNPSTFVGTESTSVIQFSNVYDRLLQLSTNFTVAPMIAKSYNLSADHKTLTFDLRSDIKFWDGTPLNADAVVANYLDKQAKKAAVNAIVMGMMTGVTALKIGRAHV